MIDTFAKQTDSPMSSAATSTRPFGDLGIEEPDSVACIAVRWQIAQRVHACSERIDDVDNDRFSDLAAPLFRDAREPERTRRYRQGR